MNTATAKPATTPIPVQLSELEFTAFILPHLSMPKRGPKCKLGYYQVLNPTATLLEHTTQTQGFMGVSEAAFLRCLRP